MKKNVDYNLSKIYPILDKLSDIERINIYGYSFNVINSVYINDLYKRTYKNYPHWNISYFSDKDLININNFVNSHGLTESEYTLFKLSDILST